MPFLYSVFRKYKQEHVLAHSMNLALSSYRKEQKTLKERKTSGAPKAHACNPSYSGVKKDQEDHGSKPVQADSL
jgi:hypothetical protein